MKICESRHKVLNQNIGEILEAIFDKTLTSKILSEFVARQWHGHNFVFKYDDIDTFKTKIDAEAKKVLTSFHGRNNQPISSSSHIYGSHNTASARLVFDPPIENPGLEGIEAHTHPVASIIVVTEGDGEFFLLFNERKKHCVRVSLSPGIVVCFPAWVVHTMTPGNNGIYTLNITDRQNQPPYRNNYSLDRNENPFQLLPALDFAKAANIPENLKLEDYHNFIKENTRFS